MINGSIFKCSVRNIWMWMPSTNQGAFDEKEEDRIGSVIEVEVTEREE
jgi:hypothetical protein